MYNPGSQKFGRGGATSRGGGANGGSKRKSFPPPPHRHSTPSSNNRISLGGSNSRCRTPSYSTAVTPPQIAEESFRLVGGGPLSLAAIIRLTPELADDIRRLEAAGGAARIKFDYNDKNPGNIIDVGDKEYHFSWIDEKDCDIYEEHKGGEDGDGLLVETGYAWRKLTIKRVLDESAKNHVKQKTKESQEKDKSRRTIILEAGNPSMKSQPVEASPWKHKQKKDIQFKNRNTEHQATAPPKPVHRPALPSTNAARGRHSTSPLPSPQNQYISFSSPSARGSAADIRTVYDRTNAEARVENANSPYKFSSPRVTARMHEGSAHRNTEEAGVLDLQHSLTTLLKNNSKGTSLKALEKALGDVSTSGSARRIEPILKKIATYEPPGRYVLKPGFEIGNMKSSPENDHQKQIVSENVYGGVPVPDSGFAGKSPAYNMEEQVSLNNNLEIEANVVENFDPAQHLTALFGDDEAPDHNDAKAASSSNSDSASSDSDSDSASSDSGSRSRSKSPAGSVSASSSNSEADSSANSKEASDVEVDIMNDGDQVPKNLQNKGHELSEKLMPWSMHETEADGNNSVQNGYVSEDVDIENDFLGDNDANLASASHDLGTPTENIRIVSPERAQQKTYSSTDMVNEGEYDGDKFKQESSGSILNSKNKSKRGSNVVHMEQNTGNVKRLKGRSLAQSLLSEHMGSHTLPSPSQTLPDIRGADHRDNHRLQMSNQSDRNDNANGNIGEEKGYNHRVPGKSNVESLQSSRRPPVRSNITDNADRPAKNLLSFGLGAKDQEINAVAQKDIPKLGDKYVIEAQDQEGSSNEKENGMSKYDSARNKKSSDTSTRRNFGLSTNDASKADFGKSQGRKLQRELSDLEVGEFRQPLAEESKTNKKLEKVGSFKQSEAKLGAGSRNTDLKANFTNRPTLDPGNVSSPNLRVPGKPDSLSKRRSPEHYVEDAVRLQRGIQSQQQQLRNVHAEVESLANEAVDLNRLEYGDAFANQGTDVEGYGETQRKSYNNAPHEDSRQELKSHKGKGSKSRKSKLKGDGETKSRDVSSGLMDKRKRNESSSDENASYSKYEKDEPELKGPIKSFSQYKEYAQEFCDKYDSYCSLNKSLENYRNEFQKLGSDLESVKGKDTERYYGILAQLKESYRQCGTQHKRLKKIFIVLHEELKNLKQRIKDFAVDYMRD